MHAPHSGSPGTGLGGVGTLPQYSNITCLTAVGNNAMNGSQTPPMAHAALGMSAAPLPAAHPGSASSPGAVLQSDYAPAASLVAAGYSYATSGSGLDNGKCARQSVSRSVSAWVSVSISDKQWQGGGGLVRGNLQLRLPPHSNNIWYNGIGSSDLYLRRFIAVGVVVGAGAGGGVSVAALCEF